MIPGAKHYKETEGLESLGREPLEERGKLSITNYRVLLFSVSIQFSPEKFVC